MVSSAARASAEAAIEAAIEAAPGYYQHHMNRAILQEVGGSWHVAFKVTQATFDDLMQRVTKASVPVRKIDHGYCVSMYLKTPDGLRLEFTVDAPDAEKIAAMRRKDAHSELARWLAGDRRVNNDDRPH